MDRKVRRADDRDLHWQAGPAYGLREINVGLDPGRGGQVRVMAGLERGGMTVAANLLWCTRDAATVKPGGASWPVTPRVDRRPSSSLDQFYDPPTIRTGGHQVGALRRIAGKALATATDRPQMLEKDLVVFGVTDPDRLSWRDPEFARARPPGPLLYPPPREAPSPTPCSG